MSNPVLNNNPVPPEQKTPTATITVGTVTLKDTRGQYNDPPSGPPSVPLDDVLVNRYEQDGHTYMMGISSPGGFSNSDGTVAFVRLASKTLLWIADWTTARIGQQPEIPDPESVSNDWVLLDGHIELHNLDVGVDGVSAMYRISGTYFYGHKNPGSALTTYVNYPRPVWLQDSFKRTIPLSKLKGGLITVTGGGQTPAAGVQGFITGIRF